MRYAQFRKMDNSRTKMPNTDIVGLAAQMVLRNCDQYAFITIVYLNAMNSVLYPRLRWLCFGGCIATCYVLLVLGRKSHNIQSFGLQISKPVSGKKGARFWAGVWMVCSVTVGVGCENVVLGRFPGPSHAIPLSHPPKACHGAEAQRN